MKKIVISLLAVGMAVSFAEAADAQKRLFAFHLDFNISVMNRAGIVRTLDHVAGQGYNAILWEIENSVRFDCCPEVASPDAFSKDEFRQILAEARKRGLEPIPLMQTFGHGEYVLSHDRFKPLRERADRTDCYCPSKPDTLRFQKQLLHEYLELFGKDLKRFHLGGDEAWVYRSCSDCKARKPDELYISHLVAVAAELREKGIRPGVWHDMLGGFDASGACYAKLPKDFALWFWDYAETGRDNWARGQEAALRREVAGGRDVIYCGALRSFVDSPFFVRPKYHRDNLTSSIDACLREGLAGYCVTSWAIHQSPLEGQYPLIDYAARRYLRPGKDPAADWREIVGSYYRGVVSVDELDKAGEWDTALARVDGRRHGQYKDGTIPPPGSFEKKASSLDQAKRKRLADALRTNSAFARAVAGKLASLPDAQQTRHIRHVRTALELKADHQDLLAYGLDAQNRPSSPFPRLKAASLYAEELGPDASWRAVERITRLHED